MNIPKVEDTERLDLQLLFLDASAIETWERLREYARRIEETGLARVAFASPWRPTVVGTDRWVDRLW